MDNVFITYFYVYATVDRHGIHGRSLANVVALVRSVSVSKISVPASEIIVQRDLDCAYSLLAQLCSHLYVPKRTSDGSRVVRTRVCMNFLTLPRIYSWQTANELN